MRTALAVSLLALLVLSSPAWAGGTTEPSGSAAGEATTAAASASDRQAPMLAALVATGELPPLAERLPDAPMVIQPAEEIGSYGGEMVRAWLGIGDRWGMRKLIGEGIVQFAQDASQVEANVLDSFEISPDARVYTLRTRPGMKWSDGEPFTADDVMFAVNDILLNTDLRPSPPSHIVTVGQPVVAEKVDDHTVTFTFAEPYGNFLEAISLSYYGRYYQPSHYLQQFHASYAPAAELSKLASEAGVNGWPELFKLRWADEDFLKQEVPTVYAWRAVNDFSQPRFVMERNPYFWKVDTAGNQLPYVDKLTNVLVESIDIIPLKAVSGELDFQVRHVLFKDFTLFMENRSQGDYRVLQWDTTVGADPYFFPNLTVKDPVLRKLFETPEFRFALSLGIKRDEINQLIWSDQATPRQASLTRNSKYYSERWANSYIDYDPDRANQLLDQVGLVNRDANGFRLRSDGEPLVLNIEYASVFGPWDDTVNLVKGWWENDLGIRVAIRTIDRALWDSKATGNELQMSMWFMDSIANLVASPIRFVPMSIQWGGAAYTEWYTSGGRSGEEPTGDVRELIDLWEAIKSTADKEEQDRLARRMVEIHQQNVFMIGTVGEVRQLVIASNRLRNVPENVLHDNVTRATGNAVSAQFFIRE